MTRLAFEFGRPFLVSGDPQERPQFQVGDRVPQTGVYSVFHEGHRLSHDVILLRDEVFPRCAQCGPTVRFELVRHAPQVEEDAEFKRRKLFEIPHPDNPEARTEVA